METIKVELPIKRRYLYSNLYTFETAILEVEPINYERAMVYRSGVEQEYFYYAFFELPEGVLVEKGSVIVGSDGLVKGLIDRKENKSWMPPVHGWNLDKWRKDRNDRGK